MILSSIEDIQFIIVSERYCDFRRWSVFTKWITAYVAINRPLAWAVTPTWLPNWTFCRCTCQKYTCVFRQLHSWSLQTIPGCLKALSFTVECGFEVISTSRCFIVTKAFRETTLIQQLNAFILVITGKLLRVLCLFGVLSSKYVCAAAKHSRKRKTSRVTKNWNNTCLPTSSSYLKMLLGKKQFASILVLR